MFDPELARSTVYFEKQEVGSQLCVLHCLNNVLQGPYFTLEDLAAISTRLDDAERALLHGEELLQSYARDSLNSSETGFFSVQVLQAALSVYGVHWQPVGRDVPRQRALHAVAREAVAYGALLCYRSLHWLALRRFGRKPACRRWVVLDSSKARPELKQTQEVMTFITQQARAGAIIFGIPKEELPESLADQSGLWDTE